MVMNGTVLVVDGEHKNATCLLTLLYFMLSCSTNPPFAQQHLHDPLKSTESSVNIDWTISEDGCASCVGSSRYAYDFLDGVPHHRHLPLPVFDKIASYGQRRGRELTKVLRFAEL